MFEGQSGGAHAVAILTGWLFGCWDTELAFVCFPYVGPLLLNLALLTVPLILLSKEFGVRSGDR